MQHKSRQSPLRGTEQFGVAVAGARARAISGLMYNHQRARAHTTITIYHKTSETRCRKLQKMTTSLSRETTALLRRMQFDIAWETGQSRIHRCTTMVWNMSEVSKGRRCSYPYNRRTTLKWHTTIQNHQNS